MIKVDRPAAGALLIPSCIGLVSDQLFQSRLKIPLANGKQGPVALTNEKQEKLTNFRRGLHNRAE